MAIPPDRNMHSDKGSPSTSEGRKSSKPIMEKRRRARINASLLELKSLLLEVIKKEGSRHSKMEKADILEMTVKHLRQLQRQQFTGSPKTDSNVLNNYRLGFDECAQEVTRYLSQMEVCDVDLRSRILNHLATCVSSGIFNPSPPTTPESTGPQSSSPGSQACASSPPFPVSPQISLAAPTQQGISTPLQDQASRSLEFSPIASSCATAGPSQPVQMTKVVSGVQVIPTKLQSGEIAFVLPGNVVSAGAPVPSYIIPVYPQVSETPPQPNIQTIPSATIINPAIVPSVPFAQQPAQQLVIPRTSSDTFTPLVTNQFMSMSTQQTTPSVNVFRPTLPIFPSSATVTSEHEVSRSQSYPVSASDDQAARPEAPRDDSMWRPW